MIDALALAMLLGYAAALGWKACTTTSRRIDADVAFLRSMPNGRPQ